VIYAVFSMRSSVSSTVFCCFLSLVWNVKSVTCLISAENTSILSSSIAHDIEVWSSNELLYYIAYIHHNTFTPQTTQSLEWDTQSKTTQSLEWDTQSKTTQSLEWDTQSKTTQSLEWDTQSKTTQSLEWDTQSKTTTQNVSDLVSLLK